MTAIPYHPDLPSPTNRDSAASAIFNLYDYSSRDSVINVSNKRESRDAQFVSYGTDERKGIEQPVGEQMEELESPRIAEEPVHKARRRTSSQRSRRASGILQAPNELSQSELQVSGIANGTDFPIQSYVVLGTPVTGEPSVTVNEYHEGGEQNPSTLDNSSQKPTLTDVTNRSESQQSSHLRQPQLPSRLAEPSRQPTNGNGIQSQSSHQQYIAQTEGRQPLDPTQSFQERNSRLRRPSTSLTNFTPTRQQGEEEDAYHVRATYARLEMQGVYGDGWEEGIERTRERAVVSKRRESLPPLARSDALVEEERKALAKVDR
jgi:hypothetical protein